MPLQLPLFTPKAEWAPTPVVDLPDWPEHGRVAVDVETRDEHLKKLGIGVRRGGYITGVSFSIEDGPGFYLPIRHEGGDNLPSDEVLRYVRGQAARFQGVIAGAKLDYDLDYLAEVGVEFRPKMFRDVCIAEPLIDELQDAYGLDAIAKRHGLPGKDESLLREAAAVFKVDPKKGMWQLPARFVGPYAEADTHLPLQILRRQEKIIEERDLWGIYDLESQVLPVLVRMRRRGVRVNLDTLDRLERWSHVQQDEAFAVIKRDTGLTIGKKDVWQKDALGPALRAVGIEPGRTAAGDDQIDKELLKSKLPVAQAILTARKMDKLRGYARSVRDHEVNGRIHCTFTQMVREDEDGSIKGARPGRLSCVMPNLQQQFSRDEFAPEWRATYEADEGGIWACNDYSQQEPRWTTHFAALMDLPGARETAQAYHDDPLLDNHDFMAKMTNLERKYAKNVYLGVCYGEGGAKLCRDCGLPTRWALSIGRGRDWKVRYFESRAEAMEARGQVEGGRVYEAAGEKGQEILDAFDRRAPFIRKLAKKASEVAASRGHVITILGRQLHFPQRDDGSYDYTHKALNRVIQGSSADQMKKAMVDADAASFPLQLQVHDELDLTVGTVAEAQRLAELMRDAIPARVPFRVDVEIGPNWGKIEKVK